jgi:hypothetical protein
MAHRGDDFVSLDAGEAVGSAPAAEETVFQGPDHLRGKVHGPEDQAACDGLSAPGEGVLFAGDAEDGAASLAETTAIALGDGIE